MCIRDRPKVDAPNDGVESIENNQIAPPKKKGFFSRLSKALGEDNQTPVSYTHLDVYKRQGLVSSGLVIINPPYGLNEVLKDTMGQLTTILSKNHGAKYTLEAFESI